MKKFFTLALVAMATVMNADAKFTLQSTWIGWEATAQVDGTTITFTEAWAGAGYWLAGESKLDLSDYDYIVIQLKEASEVGFNFCVQSIDGDKKAVGENFAKGNIGDEYAAISLMDGTIKDYVDQISQVWIQSSTGAGTVKIDEVYAATEDEYKALIAGDADKEKKAIKFKGPWTASFEGGNDNWDWQNPAWFGDTNLNETYKTVVVEVSAATANFQVTLQDWDGANGTMTSIQCGAVKDEPAIIAFSIAELQNPGVGQVAFQNANQVGVYTKEDGTEGGVMGALEVTVSQIYYTSAEVASNYPAPAAYETGIQAIQTEAQETAAYNVVGKRAQKNAKGILFVGGKKIINL